MIQPRDEAHMFLLELWAEHQRLTSGVDLKLWQPNVKKGLYFLDPQLEFEKIKPLAFIQADECLCDLNAYVYTSSLRHVFDIIQKADNRMIQGDFRYGSIVRQDLSGYEVDREFEKRFILATQHKSLELLIDAYNMARIQYYKDSNYDTMTYRIRIVLRDYCNAIEFAMGWTFEDTTGTHAEKKT